MWLICSRMPTPSPVLPSASLPARCSSRSTMRQCIVHGLVALAALDVHHSADAAGIVLELWIVQAKGVRFAL